MRIQIFLTLTPGPGMEKFGPGNRDNHPVSQQWLVLLCLLCTRHLLLDSKSEHQIGVSSV